MGRATQGVRLISLRGDDQIASVCRVPKSDDEPMNEDGEDAADGAADETSNGEGAPTTPEA